jgi:endonuclease YncB( thermonuclease family)
MTSSRRQFSFGSRQIAAAILMVSLAAPASFAAPRKAPGTSGACPAQGDSRAVVAGVDERLDVALEDGRILHLAGVDPPRPTPEAPELDMQARDRLAAIIRGRTVSFTSLAPKPDRWGRIPAFVFVEVSDAADHSIAAMLLEAGFARVRPQAEIRPCLKIWLAAEAEARRAGLGLWADPYYAILAVGEGSAFAEKAATDIIVEGRLADAVAGRTGVRLEFGPLEAGSGRSRNFSVIILQRNVRIFEQAGMKFNSLIGRNLRIRGLLDMRFGPQIEISSPDEVELIAGEDNQAKLEAQASKPNAITPVPHKEP